MFSYHKDFASRRLVRFWGHDRDLAAICGGFPTGSWHNGRAEVAMARVNHSRDTQAIAEACYYIRVSSAEQEQGFSLDAQVRAAREYAAAHGLKPVKEFADIESAMLAGRTQFTAILAYLKRNRSCQAIVVEKTDRLYRNLKDWVEVDELMQAVDLTVHRYKEGSVLTSDSRSHEKIIHGIKVLMAKNFIDNLSEEVKKGMNEKARQGHFPGLAPVGYRNNPATKVLDVDPERAPLVRQDGVLTLPYREPFAWLALAAHTLTSQEAPDPADRRLPEIRGGWLGSVRTFCEAIATGNWVRVVMEVPDCDHQLAAIAVNTETT